MRKSSLCALYKQLGEVDLDMAHLDKLTKNMLAIACGTKKEMT